MRQVRISSIVVVSLVILGATGMNAESAIPGSTSGAPSAKTVHPAVTPGFLLEASPGTVKLSPGGDSEEVTIVAFPQNGFSGSIAVTAGAMPTGITMTPSTFSMAAGAVHVVTLSASSAAKAGASSIHFSGVAGAVTGSATLSVSVQALANATLSATFFDFGNDFIQRSVVQTVVAVKNTGTAALTMSPVLTGNASFSVVAKSSCGAQLAAGKTCDMVLKYAPTAASVPKGQSALLNMRFGNVPEGTPQTIAIHGTSAVVPKGTVTPTHNPQVALYTMTMPFAGKMVVSFGKTTAYGLHTWSQGTDTAGGKVSIFVAGMQQNTTYHMRATVELANGLTAFDEDHTFTTGSIPAALKMNLSVATTAGMTPQPGIELLNPVSGLVATDLSGNPLWAYQAPGDPTLNFLQGAKQLPNGNILITLGELNSEALNGAFPADAFLEIREINLAGDLVREITMNDLNQELSTATCAECGVQLEDFHHDVLQLANGHWIVIGTTLRNLSPTSVPPLTTAAAQPVLGDVIVDLDENLQPVWAWNEFNHLDPNRHPMLFPDWTHTNAILYSQDDGNLLVSIRHQNWVVKVNYKNGTGDGKILWHLGEGGDFKLVGGTDPIDWHYAQHDPGLFSKNTAGIFSLGVMDNGDDRIYPSGSPCNVTGTLPLNCFYSTVPVYKIDETAMTATFTFRQVLPTKLYSSYGGNTDELANGNVEYDLCGVGGDSYVREVTQEKSPKLVWQMSLTGGNLYRAFRIPSLYPGVQW